jgi:hypothetical protein
MDETTSPTPATPSNEALVARVEKLEHSVELLIKLCELQQRLLTVTGERQRLVENLVVPGATNRPRPRLENA